ncbi:MAG TPA: DnaB-like helicase C-terminal domain-containing protein [Anaerolineaceae bacterium]|nr:DnaB-like helicase C-terminal domain-containing protein [Anaerolineaceae bacterium]
MTRPSVQPQANLVFGPQEAAALAVGLLEVHRQERQTGIKFEIARLDEVLSPLRSGELISVYGLPGHHKSSLMNWLSRRALALISPESDEIVVRATWEQSVEEDTLHWLAGDSRIPVNRMVRGDLNEAEWQILLASSVRRAVSPMWIVGHSQSRSSQRRQARPRMSLTDIALAIEYICEDAAERKLKPKLVVLDYLQRIRPDPRDGGERREQVMEMVNRAKDCALSFGCPVLLGVQARREVAERPNKMPRQDDAQETSNVEQTSDKIITLWYPHKTEKPGAVLQTVRHAPRMEGQQDQVASPGVEEWTVNLNLLLVGIPKQKLGPTVEAVPVFVDPARGHFANLAPPPSRPLRHPGRPAE